MYKTIRIRNFRCFEDLEVGPFTLLNIITGPNGAGKTALLEAMFVHGAADSPEAVNTLDPLRHVRTFRASAESVWGWMFRNLELDARIELVAEFVDGTKHRVELALAPEDRYVMEIPGAEDNEGSLGGPVSPDGKRKALTIKYVGPSGQERELVLRVRGSEIVANRRPGQPLVGAFFRGAGSLAPSEQVLRLWGELEKQKRKADVISVLQTMEPRLTDLAAVPVGGSEVAIMHCELGLPQMVPLQVAGAGLCRLFSIAVQTIMTQRGVLLADEIENGIYYESLPQLWKALGKLAKQHEVQIFATTHSQECIIAALEGLGDEATELVSLHRLFWRDRKVASSSYSADLIRAAVEIGLEVR